MMFWNEVVGALRVGTLGPVALHVHSMHIDRASAHAN